MGRIECMSARDAGSPSDTATARPHRSRARAVLGWVTFEPGLYSQLLEAEAFVRRLPRSADAAGRLRLAFLARDQDLLDEALDSARDTARGP